MTELRPVPYFSVIIPTFNRKCILTKAIDSLISQTEKNWEGIIVDDGSDDDTFGYISHYLKRDSRIQYIRQENAGAALAKNKGIAIASGATRPWVSMWDGKTQTCA